MNATTMAKGFTPNMGFQAGKPCILLKLNRIIDLAPGDIFISIGPRDKLTKTYFSAYYNDTTVKKITEKVSGLEHKVPDDLIKHIDGVTNKNQVWVDCHGEWPFDRESMGGIEYYPKDRGFSNEFFPYMKKQASLKIAHSAKLKIINGV